VTEKKSASQNKNIFSRLWQNIRQITRETIGELRKVNWPTREEAIHLTRIVLVVILLMAIVLAIFDFIFSNLFELVLTST
jgi:preprotein translocase subunit SecE